MEAGHTTIPSSMKEKFIEHLNKNTIPWEKRPFIPAGSGKIVCKLQGDSFSLQEDGHSAPRPIVNCQVTQVGQNCEITWHEAPQTGFQIYFVMWTSFLWFLILSSGPEPTGILGGMVMTAMGFGIVMFNNHLAHGKARRVGEFVCRMASELTNSDAKP